jgi:RHS repeat-associated protein
VRKQGHFPYGEAWYSQNGNEFVFTSYSRDTATGLDYAMARFYDSSAGRFCSADPVGGDPNDPQSWNRYLYSRDDPVNMSDPSGQHSFWYWLAKVFEIAAAVILGVEFLDPALAWTFNSAGEVVPSILTQIDNGLSVAAGGANLAAEAAEEQSGPSAPAPQTSSTTARTICGPWQLSLTVVGGHQAPGKGAFSGTKPAVGDAAIDPTQFGYPDYYDLASQIDAADPTHNSKQFPNSAASFSALQVEQKALKNANITINVTSPTPSGLPSGPYTGTDAIHPEQEDTVDIYRTPTLREARKLGRIPATATVSFNPSGNVECPR